MWPWEHAAVGYVLFSLFSRAVFDRSPDGVSAVLLVAGTQIPDAIDKTLSWGLGLFPSGFAVAHSVFVAVPVGIAVAVLAHRYRRSVAGLAVTLGYWSHLVADVVNPLRDGDGIDVSRVLWPLVEQEAYSQDLGLGRGIVYLLDFVTELSLSSLSTVALLYLSLPVFAFVLWVADGTPGLALLRDLTVGRLS